MYMLSCIQAIDFVNIFSIGLCSLWTYCGGALRDGSSAIHLIGVQLANAMEVQTCTVRGQFVGDVYH